MKDWKAETIKLIQEFYSVKIKDESPQMALAITAARFGITERFAREIVEAAKA